MFLSGNRPFRFPFELIDWINWSRSFLRDFFFSRTVSIWNPVPRLSFFLTKSYPRGSMVNNKRFIKKKKRHDNKIIQHDYWKIENRQQHIAPSKGEKRKGWWEARTSDQESGEALQCLYYKSDEKQVRIDRNSRIFRIVGPSSWIVGK